MPIVIPAADSSDQIDDLDLVMTLRAADTGDSSKNYGVRAQSFAHLMPEHRVLSTTLTATTGMDSTWAITWDSGHLANPQHVRIDVWSKWTQAGQGADTSWSVFTWGTVFRPTIGASRGGWWHMMVPGDADSNRMGHTTRTSDGNIRVGTSSIDGSNGWNMDWDTGTSTLQLDQIGTPPFGRYNVQTLLAAVTL